MKIDDALRYGTMLTDDSFHHYYEDEDILAFVRIRLVSYEGDIYYTKMINSEVVEFKKVGVVG